MKVIIYSVIISVLVGIVIFLSFENIPSSPLLGNVHHHADFKVYVYGEEINFSSHEYMSTNETKHSNFIHLHDLDGEVIHKHMTGISVGELFESIDLKFNSTCLELENQEKYCNIENNTLKFFVNRKENSAYEKYEFNDLDQMLISFGNETDEGLQDQFNFITDKACIQSGRCKERGMPSDESDCASDDDCTV